MPYTMDANDGKFASAAGFGTPFDFENYLTSAFDRLYEEGAESPGMMSIGLHARITGRPARAQALARFLDHVRKHDKVWICRRIDVANHWRSRFPAGR